MKTFRLPSSPAAREAAVAAALMMSWQIAAKATRDGLFLAAFQPTALPAMIGAAAVCSIFMAVISAKLLRKFGPFRLIPAGYLVGALLHGAEWTLLPDFPKVVPAFVYIHVVAIGSVLLSGFWALANERFDPREARRRFGTITAAGTLGSLTGGVMAERVASLGSSTDLLILLAVLQLLCAAALFKFAPARPSQKPPAAPSFPEVISGAPYLVGLAILVVLAAMSASMLDYLFKAQSVTQFGRGPLLSRFFAVFYAVTSVVTFGFQMGLSRLWLKRFGPGKTVAVLPVAVAGVSVGSLLIPGSITLIVSRAIELLLRGSLYRSGYELFYTPMPPAEKRSVKSVIDIGAERLGDGLAGASIQLLLVLPAALASSAILACTAGLSGLAAWLAFRLDRAYVTVLEKGLVSNVVKMTPEDAEDSVTRSIVLQTMMTIPAGAREAGAFTSLTAAHTPALPQDPVVRRLADLRSGDPFRIRAVLMREDPLDAVLVPQVIDLLGSDDVAHAAYAALSRVKDRISGQLVDVLNDESAKFTVRKRIPKILGSCAGHTAWEGMLRQLRNERFEIRVRCARALEKIQQNHPDKHQMERAAILELVGMELSSARKFSANQSSSQNLMVDEVFKERTSKSMAHIFTLLGLVLPAQPVRLAFRALRTEDAKLRGVAMEYLDSVLPVALREQLSAHFEGSASTRKDARSGEALANLLDSSPSIMARLEEMGFDKKSTKTGDSSPE